MGSDYFSSFFLKRDLFLMIISQVKCSLLRKRQPSRIRLPQNGFQFSDLTYRTILYRRLPASADASPQDYPKSEKIIAGVAEAELKYLSLMVALMPGLALSCNASYTQNSLPRV